MKSMTGFGRGEAEGDGIRCVVEASSLNRKQLEVVPVLPPSLADKEREVRTLGQKALSRGMVRIGVQVEEESEGDNAKPKINQEVALAYLEEIKTLAKATGEERLPNLAAVVRLPGVLEEAEPDAADTDRIWPVAEKAILAALEALVSMREGEGEYLRTDLQERIEEVRRHVAEISTISETVVEAQKKRLFARLEESGIDLDWDDDRLAKEIGIFAERCDISEELTRLESHFLKFEEMLAQEEPAGRSLDFLGQEMFRELNTITTKGSDAGIAHHAVAAKTEVERIREQVQNVE